VPPTKRVTVTLPANVLEDIDRIEPNRSRFVLEAVRHDLQRRRKEELRRSLRSAHSESGRLAEEGFPEWAKSLPDEETSDLVDPRSGTPVRWIPGEGWTPRK
jgi:Arc/MetJ-type ribon-helix-helix transcriptional regulator